MIFHDTKLAGCYLVEPELFEDERGCFARVFDGDEFRRRGLNPSVAQCSFSHNRLAGTLRGLHYQAPPFEEAKLVRCVGGHVFDVAVDLRRQSPSYLRWEAFELSGQNRLAVYLPEGLAHGFLTLTDDAELVYQISVAYDAASSRGIRWDDPALGIAWPKRPVLISGRDAAWPSLATSTPRGRGNEAT